MKKCLIIGIVYFVMLSIGCQSKSNAPQFKEQFYYVEFVDQANTARSNRLMEQVHKELIHGTGYFMGNENNENQGIEPFNTSKLIQPSDLNEQNPYIHLFKEAKYYENRSDDSFEKIVITYNENEYKTPELSYRSYKKDSNDEWKSVFNPGSFKYTNKSKYTEKDIVNWMVKTIVLLTYKP